MPVNISGSFSDSALIRHTASHYAFQDTSFSSPVGVVSDTLDHHAEPLPRGMKLGLRLPPPGYVRMWTFSCITRRTSLSVVVRRTTPFM